MADIDQKKHLRKFGLITSIPFVLLSAYLFYKGRPAAPYVLAPAVFLSGLALVWPALLGPVERWWMWLAGKLQIVSTTIILTTAYLLILTPTGLVMRLFGRDILLRKRQETDTFWVDADKDGSAVRHSKPY